MRGEAMLSCCVGRAETRGLGALLVVVLVALAAGGLPMTASADVGGDPEEGRELFATNCAACHGPQAQGGGDAPSLVGATGRLGADGVASTVREGRGRMPAFGDRLEETEIDHLVAHLDRLAAGPEVDDVRRSRMPMMDDRWRGMPGGWPLGVGLVWVAVVLVVVVLIVAGVVWFARRLDGAGAQSDAGRASTSAARDILDQRYARGEISREEYLEVRRDLEGEG
jgi:putative membrane protein